MLTSGINFINFKVNIKTKKLLLKKKFIFLIKEKNQVIASLDKNYRNSFNKKN